MRRVAWFSCGAASAIATLLSRPDVVAYCDTGAEDADNVRFMRDFHAATGVDIEVIAHPRFRSTWEVWEWKQYINGIGGAPCTKYLKIAPRLDYQEPGDIHIFGYTADGADVKRANALRENWPELDCEFPLIERGLTKAACLEMIDHLGLQLPRTYAMGFPNANCIPCCKASSPAYWALVRQHFKREYRRMAKLSLRLNCKLVTINGKRAHLYEIPRGQPTTQPIAHDCDFLCQIAQSEITLNGE